MVGTKPLLTTLVYSAALAISFSSEAQQGYVEIEKITAPRASPLDEFGAQVEVHGDTLAIGRARGFFLERPGAVYMYQQQAGLWELVQKIEPRELIPTFGDKLSLDGDLLAIDAASETDVHYLYERDERGVWKQVFERVQQSEGDAVSDIAVSGDTLVTTNAATEVARIYARDHGGTNQWGLVEVLEPSDPTYSLAFGRAVAIDGDVLAVADNGDTELGFFAGAVWVFERASDGTWTESAKLLASDGAERDEFGNAVSVHGDTIVVGARLHDHDGVAGTGAVYVFEREESGSWLEVSELIADDVSLGDALGSAVANDDRTIAVGAHGVAIGGHENAGAVYTFELDGYGFWSQTAKVAASDPTLFQELGVAVSVSRGTVVAGAPTDDQAGFSAGAAYVFQRVASPQLTASGACPGVLILDLEGATPSGPVAVVRGDEVGATPVPIGHCEGSLLDLEDATLLRVFLADSDGSKSFARTAGVGACGGLVQPLDLVTCGLGEPIQIPRSTNH